LNQALFITEDFIKYDAAHKDASLPKEVTFGIVSMPRAGGSTLLQELVYNPQYRFATITEQLSKE